MYKIVGSFKKSGGWKLIDTASDREEAIEMVKMYRKEFGNEWNIIYYNTED